MLYFFFSTLNTEQYADERENIESIYFKKEVGFYVNVIHSNMKVGVDEIPWVIQVIYFKAFEECNEVQSVAFVVVS